MGKLPRFNNLQFRQMRSLIRKHCCNFQDGNCCTLDDGIDPSCAQWNSYSLQCIWFRDAVLPLSPALHEKVLGISNQYRQCVLCHRYFIPTGNRAVYCPKCSLSQQRKKTRDRVRRHRRRM